MEQPEPVVSPYGSTWNMPGSEERPLAGDAVAPRVPIGAGPRLPEHLQRDRSLRSGQGAQPKLRAAVVRPAPRTLRLLHTVSFLTEGARDRHRGFGDREVPSGGEEGRRALGGRCRRTEATGDHEIEPAPKFRVSTRDLRTLADDPDAVQPTEGRNGVAQEVRPPAVRVEQYELRHRPELGQHEPRQTTTGAEVEDHPHGRAGAKRRRDRRGHAERVLELPFDRARPQEAKLARLAEVKEE